jgi:hypothetical protein
VGGGWCASPPAQQSPAPAAPESHHADAAAPQPGAPAGNTAATGSAPATEEVAEPGVTGELAKPSPKAADGVGQSAAGGSAGAAGPPEAARPAQAEPAPPPAESYAAAATPSPVPLPAAAPAPRALVLRDVAPQPTPAPTTESVEVAKERARDEAAATKRHGPQRGNSGAASGLASVAEASKDAPSSRRARAPLKVEANRAESDEAKAGRGGDREQRAATRSVGGRSFRREGGVWIDTAYRQSQATVTVRRDSEQYRALVADEPEIGRISRALGGEAVIVWKGRAYRVKP